MLELGLKRGRKELAEEWKAIRRGGYVGGTEFKERMLGLVEPPLRQGRSGCYSGEAKRAHGEAEAERLGMGDESRVTQAIGRVRRNGPPELERLKRRLEQVYDNNNREVEV